MFRFLLVGGSNTIVTGAIVVALSYVMHGSLAFTIAFALGLIYSVLLTGRWVFSSTLTRRRTSLFIAAYSIMYLCGLCVVAVLSAFSLPPWVNGTSVFVTAPLSFVAGRTIFTRSSKRQEATP